MINLVNDMFNRMVGLFFSNEEEEPEEKSGRMRKDDKPHDEVMDLLLNRFRCQSAIIAEEFKLHNAKSLYNRIESFDTGLEDPVLAKQAACQADIVETCQANIAERKEELREIQDKLDKLLPPDERQ
jgi:uncharacterized coiled-coil protein SlyX